MSIIFNIIIIYLACQTHLLYQNISTLQRQASYKIPIILIMILYSFYIYYKSFSLSTKKYHHLCLHLSFINMCIGIMIPFPKTGFLYPQLHLFFTFSSVCLYLLFIILYLLHLKETNYQRAWQMLQHTFFFISIESIILFTCGAINGLSEILLSLYITYLLNKKRS